MSVQQMLDNGQLKSYTFDNGKSELISKPAPLYRLTLKVVDKKLFRQKKASKVLVIDETVPQDQLAELWHKVILEIKKLKQSVSEANPQDITNRKD